MRDDFLSSAWAENHAKFSTAFHKLIETIGVGLARANAYQFEAPWRTSKCTDR